MKRNAAKRKANPQRTPAERYTPRSYSYAVTRASEKAKVASWHPNQLRHSHATKVRKAFTLEHAGAALGHSKMSATEIYAERDADLSDRRHVRVLAGRVDRQVKRPRAAYHNEFRRRVTDADLALAGSTDKSLRSDSGGSIF